MTSPRPRIKFTYTDYKNAPGDRRYELHDGELVVPPSPNEAHQWISILLASEILRFVLRYRLGRVYSAPFDVVLSETDVVQPDILFVSKERSQLTTVGNVQGAPDLVIEILSPSTAQIDRTYKRSLYARYGVSEYWLVDPEAQTIEVLRLGEQGYETAAIYVKNGVLTSPALPGLRLNLKEVF